jgi:hypothetical protein
MKKFLAIAGILVAVILILALFNPAASPDFSASRMRMAVRDNEAYLAENRWNSSFIYKVARNGTVELVYSEPWMGLDRRSAIMELAFLNDELFFIRAYGSRTDEDFSRWELVRLGAPGEAVFSRGGAAPGLSAGEKTLYFHYISQDGGEVDIFELNPYASRVRTELVMTAAAPEGSRFLSAAYDGVKLYGSLSDGRVVSYASRLPNAQAVFAPGAPDALSVTGGNVFFADNARGTVYYDAGAGLDQRTVPEWAGAVRAGASVEGIGFVVLTQEALSWYDGASFSEPVVPRTAPDKNLFFSVLLLNGNGLWLLIAAAALAVLAGMCFIPERFFIRFSAMHVCLTVVLLTAVIWIAMSGARDSAMARIAGQALSSADLLRIENDSAVVERSDRFASGVSYDLCYDAGVADMIARSLSDGNDLMAELLSDDGQPRLISVLRVTSDNRPAILVSSASLAGVQGELDALFQRLLFWGGLAALVVYLMVLLFVWRYTHPLRQVVKRMGEIGAGRFEVEGKKQARGEVGKIQQAIQEMCVSLSIEAYKTRVTLDSYNRFVPQGLARLLGRSGIAEVECGDAETLDGDVGIVTVGNRDRIRARTDDDRFMEFVSGCFREIYSAVKEQDAIFLSDDFHLSGLRLTFPGGAESGLKFGLSLAGRRLEGESAPDFAVLLHSVKYLYGVAGEDNRAFTFLSSAELDYLNEVSPELSRLGVKLAMTEQYLSQMSDAPDTRYIGFISAPGGRHTFKLYEALDVYPADERRKRLKYDHDFQEALRLYYKNDFYLARNLFSAINKESPRDDMARWYLFACEHFFNTEDLNRVNYSIFGTEKD